MEADETKQEQKNPDTSDEIVVEADETKQELKKPDYSDDLVVEADETKQEQKKPDYSDELVVEADETRQEQKKPDYSDDPSIVVEADETKQEENKPGTSDYLVEGDETRQEMKIPENLDETNVEVSSEEPLVEDSNVEAEETRQEANGDMSVGSFQMPHRKAKTRGFNRIRSNKNNNENKDEMMKSLKEDVTVRKLDTIDVEETGHARRPMTRRERLRAKKKIKAGKDQSSKGYQKDGARPKSGNDEQKVIPERDASMDESEAKADYSNPENSGSGKMEGDYSEVKGGGTFRAAKSSTPAAGEIGNKLKKSSTESGASKDLGSSTLSIKGAKGGKSKSSKESGATTLAGSSTAIKALKTDSLESSTQPEANRVIASSSSSETAKDKIQGSQPETGSKIFLQQVILKASPKPGGSTESNKIASTSPAKKGDSSTKKSAKGGKDAGAGDSKKPDKTEVSTPPRVKDTGADIGKNPGKTEANTAPVPVLPPGPGVTTPRNGAKENDTPPKIDSEKIKSINYNPIWIGVGKLPPPAATKGKSPMYPQALSVTGQKGQGPIWTNTDYSEKPKGKEKNSITPKKDEAKNSDYAKPQSVARPEIAKKKYPKGISGKISILAFSSHPMDKVVFKREANADDDEDDDGGKTI